MLAYLLLTRFGALVNTYVTRGGSINLKTRGAAIGGSGGAHFMVCDVVHAILKRWGNTGRKQRIWNQEYGRNRWLRADDQTERVPPRRDSVLEVIERYSANGEILELGCGTGETAFEITDAYQQYVRVDISDVAIGRASEAAKRNPTRTAKISFTVGDISTFVPDGPFSVILFRESIYYIPRIKISGTLCRLAQF